MVRLRLAALLGLLALGPLAVYFLARGEVVFLVASAVSVLLVVGSLWVMFGDVVGPDGRPEA